MLTSYTWQEVQVPMNSNTAAGNCSRGPTPAVAGEKAVHKGRRITSAGMQMKRKTAKKGSTMRRKLPRVETHRETWEEAGGAAGGDAMPKITAVR